MLSQQLKRLRTDAKMSQRELAERLFVSQQAVAKWERGDATPNPETIVNISEIFQVSTDVLLGKSVLGKEQLQAAFWGGDKDLTQEEKDAMWDDVERFAAFLAQQKKQERQKND